MVIHCQRQINLKNLPPNLVVLIEDFQRVGIGLAIQQPAGVGNIYAAPFAAQSSILATAWPSAQAPDHPQSELPERRRREGQIA